MKITIDTKEDSHEEIGKAIKMLQQLVEGKVYTNSANIFEDPSSFGGSANDTPSNDSSSSEPSSGGNAFANMFGSVSTPDPTPEEPMNEEEEKESADEAIPQIITY
jgi:hypothetical protein